MVYYVTIECQGNTELVVEVDARSLSDAKYRAMEAYLADRDIDVVDKETARSICEDEGVLLVDEDGVETCFEDEEEDE